MPKFSCGDAGITIRLTLPKGQTFPSGATVKIKMTGKETGTPKLFSGTISSNSSTLACVDYTIVSSDFTVPDVYEAKSQYVAPGGIIITSQPPHPVWDVESSF
jgi:hypothetical protein